MVATSRSVHTRDSPESRSPASSASDCSGSSVAAPKAARKSVHSADRPDSPRIGSRIRAVSHSRDQTGGRRFPLDGYDWSDGVDRLPLPLTGFRIRRAPDRSGFQRLPDGLRPIWRIMRQATRSAPILRGASRSVIAASARVENELPPGAIKRFSGSKRDRSFPSIKASPTCHSHHQTPSCRSVARRPAFGCESPSPSKCRMEAGRSVP